MITFSKALSTSNFLNAYNNNTVEFSSDNALDSTKCTITIGTNTFEITPIDNVFYYNFKEIITVLINQNNFSDDIMPVLSALDDTSHVYDDSTNTYLEQLVSYEITFSNDSTETISETYKFLKSVEQLEQNKKEVIIDDSNILVLMPFKDNTSQTYNVNYFEGYPFDISLLLNDVGVTTVLNQTNALTYDFTLPNSVNRLFFSDGRTTITIDDYLPLVDGLNELKITRGTDIIYVNVNKITSREGQYIKWINQYGGWSYWLFNCIHKRSNKIKDLGSVNNDFNDLSDTTSPSFNLGKTAQDTLTLISKNVDSDNQNILNQLFESPKIYYYTGTRLSQVNSNSWVSCNIKNTSDTITDYKKQLKNYKVQIELPKRYTMTL